MAEYVNCGFVRSSLLLSTISKHSSNVYDSVILHISETLGIALPEKNATVKQKLKEYVKHIQKNKLTETERRTLINLFSFEKWSNLSDQERKNEHSLSKCQGCRQKHRSNWDMFPQTGRHAKRTRIPLSDITNTLVPTSQAPQTSSILPVILPALKPISFLASPTAVSPSASTSSSITPTSTSTSTSSKIKSMSSPASSLSSSYSEQLKSPPFQPSPVFESTPSQSPLKIKSIPSQSLLESSTSQSLLEIESTPSRSSDIEAISSSGLETRSVSVSFASVSEAGQVSSTSSKVFCPAIHSTPRTGLPVAPVQKIRPVEKRYGKQLLTSACSLFSKKYPNAPPLPQVLGSSQGTGLVLKPTATERKRNSRNDKRKIRDSQQDYFQKNSRDVDTFVETRQSKSGYAKHRAGLYFEDVEEAALRTAKKKRKTKPSESHVGKEFDREGVKSYVKGLPSNSRLVLSHVAEKFNVHCPGNKGNVIVKDYLKDCNDIDLDRFSNEWPERVRCKYSKMPGGEISYGMPRAACAISKQLKKDVESGRLRIGELIVPKKLTKLSLDENGKIVTTVTIIEGRKIPLREIREGMNKKFHRLKIFVDEASINRFLMVWSDHSTILNHGYLLLTIKAMYSQHTFLTDIEHQKRYGKRIDIQAIVETPEVYILGTCKDTILEKLSYVNERLKDIQELIPTRVGNKTIKDVLRMFQGDHPEIQYECGNSQGGKYPCPCQINHKDMSDIELSRRCEVMPLEKRRCVVMDGPAGKTAVARPFFNLRKQDLAKEIEQRNWDREISINPSVEEMATILKDKLKGIDRVPALFYGNETKTAEDIGLKSYEVSPSEPLHDLKGHISNLWASLQAPNTLTREHKDFFKKILYACYGSKSQVKGSDYRLSVIVMYANLKDEIPGLTPFPQDIVELIRTLMIICQLAYAPAQARSPKKVLLLYNVTFKHHCLIQKIFGKKWFCTKVTNNTFYGAYFHSMQSHFCEMYRYVPLSTIDAESDERIFSSFKQISIATSSRQLSHTRDNGIVRLQSEKKRKEKQLTARGGSYRKKWQSKISQFGYAMGDISNTFIPSDICTRRELQAHLESISDYMLQGEGVWWHKDAEDGIVFHDGSSEPETRPEGPDLMDFATHTLSSVYKHIKDSWKRLIDSDVNIPIEKIDVYDDDGAFLYQKHYGNESVKENENVDDEFVPEEPEEKEDNGYDLTLDPTQIFPLMPKRTFPTNEPRNDDDDESLFILYDNDTVSEKVKPIANVLGTSKLILDFDKNVRLYDTFRDKKHLVMSERSKASISGKLKTFYRKGNKWLEQWQKDFYISNAREPTSADIKDHDLASIMNYKLAVIKKTLREWKIAFV